ncbi:Protein of unknown function [Dyella jiangningensis]|uniref:DUF2612 domain-containing protein n=1 Tax=Dyella sp. AtDHG13 TaxID=1938897 RepID=UPI00087FE825|nr:DUF2612 domain-containing protein [Dyella sp. AtDHG13]PXV60875.1 uncharacterized protein DUF2612 [Dyella sp. AtDHG13]SDK94899.1 Protein of unknown function [Dyella jiangningensis]
MADVSQYTGLITSEHADKPKFSAMVAAVAQCFVDQQNALGGFIPAFDLDQAVGDQLDIIGLWVGVSRRVNTPLTGVYFSFDITGVGFDQGVWQGPFDPSTEVTLLDDDTYRTLIRAKIGANHWDGTLGSSAAILNQIFESGTHVFIQDNQDMTMTIGVSGTIPSAILLALLKGGYIPLKPEGVLVNSYIVTSSTGSPIFGFDMTGPYVSGFDSGSWAKPL